MTKWLMSIALAGVGAAASAQAPGVSYPTPPAPTPGYFLPNFYNRQVQPLSPYLNLLRSGSPAVNYFYGVRPGLQSGAVPVGGGFGVPSMAPQSRAGYLPAAANPTQEPIPIPEAGVPIPSLYQTGHPVTFGNGPGMAAPGSGTRRPGFTGGAVPPPARRPGSVIPRR